MAEDNKRLERMMKRAKPFLDDKQTPKLRMVALRSVLELGTMDIDTAKFFELHDTVILQVSLDYFAYRASKMTKATSILSGAGRESMHSKEAVELVDVIELVHRTMTQCREKMRSGWQRDAILLFVQQLLATDNHHRLRREGLRLLLLYVESHAETRHALVLGPFALPVFDLSVFATPSIQLSVFATPSIQLSVFATPSIQLSVFATPSIQLATSCMHCVGPDEVGLLAAKMLDPSHVPWTQHPQTAKAKPLESIVLRTLGNEVAENCELLCDIITKLTDLALLAIAKLVPKDQTKASVSALLASADCTSMRNLWKLLTTHVARTIFPSFYNIVYGPFDGTQNTEICTTEMCPVQLLEKFTDFISHVTLVNISFTESITTKQLATALLYELLMGSDENREFVHEILRQSLLGSNMKAAISILSGWILSPVLFC